MRFPTSVFLSILFCGSLTQDTSVEERKLNMVVKLLNEVLENALTKNVTIPEINLSESNRIKNVIVNVPKMSKWLDGLGSYGFKMITSTEILVTGYYDFKNLDIPGLFPIFGKGDFVIAVEAVNLTLEVKVTKNFENDDFDFDLKNFDLKVVDSKVKFDNLMEDPHVSDFLNEVIGKLIPNVIQMLIEPITPFLEQILDYYGNGVINCIISESPNLEKISNCIKNLFQTLQDDIIYGSLLSGSIPLVPPLK